MWWPIAQFILRIVFLACVCLYTFCHAPRNNWFVIRSSLLPVTIFFHRLLTFTCRLPQLIEITHANTLLFRVISPILVCYHPYCVCSLSLLFHHVDCAIATILGAITVHVISFTLICWPLISVFTSSPILLPARWPQLNLILSPLRQFIILDPSPGVYDYLMTIQAAVDAPNVNTSKSPISVNFDFEISC